MRKKTLFSIDKWPVYVSASVLILAILLLRQDLLQHTNGVYTLPGDGYFLQLSTAKVMAFKRTWGICNYDFAAASSSLLYPVVLMLPFFIFGASLLTVLATNTLLAIVLLGRVNRWLEGQGVRPVARLGVLMTLIAALPLPMTILSCTEQTLLLLMGFLFIRQIYDEWNLPEPSWKTYLYGALLVAARHDALLLVLAVCAVLLVYKKTWTAAGLAAAAVMPAAIFGIIALVKGWYFIPNAFLLTGRGVLLGYDWLSGVAIVTMLPVAARVAPGPPDKSRARRWAVATAALVLCAALLPRHVHAWKETREASIRLYRQQYFVGRFTHRFYRYCAIASDDIGVVSYMTDGRFLDLKGFASIKVARAGERLTAGMLSQLSTGINPQVAIVSSPYERLVPGKWIKMGSWDIPRYGKGGKDIVNFYVTDTGWAKAMQKNLAEYSTWVPNDFTIKYYHPTDTLESAVGTTAMAHHTR